MEAWGLFSLFYTGVMYYTSFSLLYRCILPYYHYFNEGYRTLEFSPGTFSHLNTYPPHYTHTRTHARTCHLTLAPPPSPAGMYAFTKDLTHSLLGPRAFREAEPTMAGEDFAFMAMKVPSCFAFLGTRNELVGAVYGLHNARFKLDEGVLPTGAALHTAWAMEFLRRAHEPTSEVAGA